MAVVGVVQGSFATLTNKVIQVYLGFIVLYGLYLVIMVCISGHGGLDGYGASVDVSQLCLHNQVWYGLYLVITV